MTSDTLILTSVQISLFGLIILLALIYSITILFPRQFRSHINILTMNLYLAVTSCALYWMIYYIMFNFNIQRLYAGNTCALVSYAQPMGTLQVPLAFIVVSLHRLCSIVYHTKGFFKTKLWLTICIASQWIAGLILSLPMFVDYWVCAVQPWKRIYTLIIIVIIPSLLCVIINGFIVIHVRASSRRVQPQITSAQMAGNHILSQPSKISRRDVHLFGHMLFMFCIFVGGWSPIHIVTIIANSVSINSIVVRSFSFLGEISLLCIAVELFVYNHKLREYLKTLMFKCCGM